MYVREKNDKRLCNTIECNVMSAEQRSTWRKKVRAIHDKAKKSNCPCYIPWSFIENFHHKRNVDTSPHLSTSQKHKVFSEASAEHPDLIEVNINE